jgi:predicted anti-sigma-YlaC factor YlaD
MKCEELVSYLSDYIDNNLDEDLTESAQEHLRTCENCRVVLDTTQQMILLYREQGKAKQIPAQRQQKLYQNLMDTFLQKSSEDQ